MFKEFEGKSEKEAIAKAMEELNLTSDQFEVEILSDASKKVGLFKKSVVRIRVHLEGGDAASGPQASPRETSSRVELTQTPQVLDKGSEFLQEMITLMGYSAQISLFQRDDGKFVFDINSEDSAILIGKQGKNLDALQSLLNAYLITLPEVEEDLDLRVIVDSQNYRQRREDAIIRAAVKNAEQVIKSKSSRLLEPMTPFERRLVHTALGHMNDIITQSEGEGLGRQIRIIYKGSR